MMQTTPTTTTTMDGWNDMNATEVEYDQFAESNFVRTSAGAPESYDAEYDEIDANNGVTENMGLLDEMVTEEKKRKREPDKQVPTYNPSNTEHGDAGNVEPETKTLKTATEEEENLLFKKK